MALVDQTCKENSEQRLANNSQESKMCDAEGEIIEKRIIDAPTMENATFMVGEARMGIESLEKKEVIKKKIGVIPS